MRKIRIRKRRILLGIIALLFVVSVGASFYFFHVAQIREEKSFINNNGRSKDNPLYAYEHLVLNLGWSSKVFLLSVG